ncbi:MAG TPA: CBS domain-containing protein [Polyangiales bacterium]|nr:CBS domain-containing protein [Polyangiales bacterium]
MHTQRLSGDDIQPLQIRLRQVFSGNGESRVTESVYCPARERSMWVDACRACDHCQGVYAGTGDASVFCDHPKAQDVPLRRIFHSRAVTPDATPVAELMTTHVFCVRPDVSLESLRTLLIERKISGVPVVDERGKPIGIVSKTDLVRHRFEDGETAAVDPRLGLGFHVSELAEGTVADVMSPLPITVSEDTPVSRVAAAMASEAVHRLPIVGADGAVVGIISALDLVGWYARREGFVVGSARR